MSFGAEHVFSAIMDILEKVRASELDHIRKAADRLAAAEDAYIPLIVGGLDNALGPDQVVEVRTEMFSADNDVVAVEPGL